jgi:hypothetical protein
MDLYLGPHGCGWNEQLAIPPDWIARWRRS